MGWAELVWDQVAAARDHQVSALGSTLDSVDYEVKFRITIDRATRDEIGSLAGKRGNKVVTLLRNVIAKGLRKFMTAEDDDQDQPAALIEPFQLRVTSVRCRRPQNSAPSSVGGAN